MTHDRLAGPSMLALVGDMSGPSLWRCLQPVTMLEKRGYPAGWAHKDAAGIGAIAAGYDGVVLPRLAWQPGQRALAEQWFRALRRAGKLVVFDCDDDLFSAEVDRRAVAFGQSDGKTLAELDEARAERLWAVAQCDGVTVSTRRLATLVRTLTDRPVIVVPNAIDVAWFRRVLRRVQKRSGACTIGWAGGRRPDDDLEPMAEGWARIARRYPGVRFAVAGYLPPVVEAAVPSARLKRTPWLPLERYPESLAGVTIGCASVKDTPFNRCKSVIKALEYAVAGAAVVATPTVYGPLLTHGVTGYLAETADEWESALAELVEHPARRSMTARRLLRVVEKEHTLEGNVHRWPEAWQRIAEDAMSRRGRLVAV